VGRTDWAEFRTAGHRAIVMTVRVAERLSKAADRFLQPYKLSLAQFNLLVVLMADPRGLPQARIGQRLVVSRANVTGLVRRMIQRGLVRVESDPGDARLKVVHLTPAGMRIVEQIEGPYFREIDRLTRPLTAGRLKALGDLLDRLERSL